MGRAGPKSAQTGEIGIVPVRVMKCTTLRTPLLACGLKEWLLATGVIP